MPSLSLQLPLSAMAMMPPLASQPASARSVDLAALVSPALHSLGVLHGSVPPSAKPPPPSAVGPAPRPGPSPRLVPSPKLGAGSSPKGAAPHHFSGERSPLGERTQMVQPAQVPSGAQGGAGGAAAEPCTPQEVVAC